MNYIRHSETEQLFKSWPVLRAILESYKVDILTARAESLNSEEIASNDEYIYSMVIGNKSIDSVPPTGKISDTTGNIAIKYDEVIKQDKIKYIEEWKELAAEARRDFLIVSAIADKISIAFNNLTALQQNILKLYYWENKVWKEVRSCICQDSSYKSESALKAERGKAISKMTAILKNAIDYATYETIMKMIDVKKEGQ